MSGPIVNLTADTRAVACSALVKLQQAGALLHSYLKPNADISQVALTEQQAVGCLKAVEYNLAGLGKTLGVVIDGADEVLRRNEEMKRMRARVKELEAQLGRAHAPDMLQGSLGQLTSHLEKWWDQEGFGYIGDIRFGKGGCFVSLSCMLYGVFRQAEESPAAAAGTDNLKWQADMLARGFAFAADSEGEWVVNDCDSSRAALCALVTKHIPSARVVKLENRYRAEDGGFTLQNIEVHIQELADIWAIPVPAA